MERCNRLGTRTLIHTTVLTLPSVKSVLVFGQAYCVYFSIDYSFIQEKCWNFYCLSLGFLKLFDLNQCMRVDKQSGLNLCSSLMCHMKCCVNQMYDFMVLTVN